jgi:hypothetical protein
MKPVGVHVWDEALWLVGVAGGRPVVAAITESGIGPPSSWDSSLATASALGNMTIRDDRSLPSRVTGWSNVHTAMGEFPFLHAHSPVKHAPGTTLWLFAGPTVTGSAIPLTSFAMAPVGVTYP